MASRWLHCVDLTGPRIEPQTFHTDSVRLAIYVWRIFPEAYKVNQIELHATPIGITDDARINRRDKNYRGTVINAGTAYAGDLVLFFPDNANLQKRINILQNTFTDFGLTSNASKTKSMIFNFHANEEYPETFCETSKVPIENLKISKYSWAQSFIAIMQT